MGTRRPPAQADLETRPGDLHVAVGDHDPRGGRPRHRAPQPGRAGRPPRPPLDPARGPRRRPGGQARLAGPGEARGRLRQGLYCGHSRGRGLRTAARGPQSPVRAVAGRFAAPRHGAGPVGLPGRAGLRGRPGCAGTDLLRAPAVCQRVQADELDAPRHYRSPDFSLRRVADPVVAVGPAVGGRRRRGCLPRPRVRRGRHGFST